MKECFHTSALSPSCFIIRPKRSRYISPTIPDLMMTKKKRNRNQLPGANNSDENKNNIDSSVSLFNFDTLSSLLPPKPLTSLNDKENDDESSYIYPVTDFPRISSFEHSIDFPAVIVPVRRTHEIKKKLKSIMLSRSLFSAVVKLSNDDDYCKNDNDKKSTGSDNDSNGGQQHILELSSDNRKDYRKIVLDPKLSGLSTSSVAEIRNDGNRNNNSMNTEMNEVLLSILEEKNKIKDGEYDSSCQLSHHTITFTYQDWTAEEILTRLLLPEGIKEIPSSFEAVGHLAHVNLRNELLPYKYLVGKVLLQKNSPRIKTVVNKLGSIDNKYRTFGMEVIAGNSDDGWSDVVVKEEGCDYRLDFRKVYWNSRLGGEHCRLVKLIRKDAINRLKKQEQTRIQRKVNNESAGCKNRDDCIDNIDVQKESLRVADLMAGIGPFAVPLTAGTVSTMTTEIRTKTPTSLPIEVFANDLNPSSYEYLVINAKRNKCDFIDCNVSYNTTNGNSIGKGWNNENEHKYKLHVYNMDARAFCHQLQDLEIRPDHYIMNLPATALEFLDAFRGYPSSSSSSSRSDDRKHDDGSSHNLPQIHVHCFAPKGIEYARREIWSRIETALGCTLDEKIDDVTIYPVRDVSPNKNMYCVSFRLPNAISRLPRIQIINQEEQDDVNERKPKKEVEPDSKKRKMDC